MERDQVSCARCTIAGLRSINSEPNSIASWRSPVLFVHGDDDRNVPFQQTTDLVKKLRAQKVFAELIIPDKIHDLLRWSDWVSARTTSFQRISQPRKSIRARMPEPLVRKTAA